jgi:excisionase family DNA binding protein
MEEPILLRMNQVCARLSLGRSLVYRLIQTQALKSVVVGSARRVRASDLDEYVRQLVDSNADDVASRNG